MALNLQTTDHIKSKGWCNLLVKRYIMVVSFPGSPALERKHWSWVGGESLVFFITRAALKVERGRRALIMYVWAYLRTRNRKKSQGSKVVGYLFHISSQQGVNYTQHIVGWKLRETLPFCFAHFFYCIMLTWEKIPGLPRVFMFRSEGRSLGTNEATFVDIQTTNPHMHTCTSRSVCKWDQKSWSVKIAPDHLIVPSKRSWLLD